MSEHRIKANMRAYLQARKKRQESKEEEEPLDLTVSSHLQADLKKIMGYIENQISELKSQVTSLTEENKALKQRLTSAAASPSKQIQDLLDLHMGEDIPSSP